MRQEIKVNKTNMITIEELLKKQKQKTEDKKMGYKNAYRFKGGTTTIRILPSWRKDAKDPTFFHSFGQSFIKDRDGKTLAVVGDRLMTYGEDCPIRNLINTALGEATTDSEREHYKDMLAKPRVLVNALVLDDKEIDPTEPQVVEFSETQFDTIVDQINMNDIANEFLSLEDGFNLKVNKSGTGFNTKYTFSFDRKPSEVSPTVMENIVDIDSFIRAQFMSAERAVNAIKDLTQQHPREPVGISYNGESSVVDATDYNTDEDEVETHTHTVISDDEINKYFKE